MSQWCLSVTRSAQTCGGLAGYRRMNEPGAVSTWLGAHTHALVLYVGAICTLGLYSVLYKENKIFRFFEHLFLGLATGYMIAINWNDMLLPKVVDAIL